ncbi:anti-sigma factor [Nonomuraea rhodomycinica]|uniref:Regulator of SigK n=2 Tax=Nonomuraea rhodomycinica TaxID=1712872 RepID=A0A7Y6IJ30_9ACTN|nr:anti-sigma factor [Nonomuraea rhodomycinica]
MAPFERHLAGCAACAAEVRRLRETAARLALPLAEPPPGGLWPRIVSAARLLRAPRPISPASWPSSPPPPPAAHVSPEDATVRLRRPPRGSGGVEEGRAGGRRDGRRRAGTVALPRVTAAAMAATAAATAAAVLLGVAARDARGDLAASRAREREVAAVLAAPDARTVRRPVASGGVGTLVVSRARGSVVFASAGLPRLPASRVYELWLMGPGGSRPAGLLDTGPGAGPVPGAGDGQAGPVPIRVREGDTRMGLTVEPAGGSRRPTTRPLLLADLPSS